MRSSVWEGDDEAQEQWILQENFRFIQENFQSREEFYTFQSECLAYASFLWATFVA
jgi:hypothetical protein